MRRIPKILFRPKFQYKEDKKYDMIKKVSKDITILFLGLGTLYSTAYICGGQFFKNKPEN